MEAPYFSIVIPTLNEETFLPKLLKDLSRQKEDHFEVVIVDAQSEDQTRRIAERYSDLFAIEVLTVKKRNVSHQRNIGANRAQGKYIIFLDADSRITPLFIKNVRRAINRYKHLMFLPYIIPQERTYENQLIFKVTNLIISISQKTKKPFSSSGSMIIQKDFFHFIGGFNEKLYLAEDHEIVQRARNCGVTAKLAKNVKIKFSLRRMSKEGRLKLLSKYLIATGHTITKGKIDKKIFDYKMGGAIYASNGKGTSGGIETFIKTNFQKIRTQVEDFITA